MVSETFAAAARDFFDGPALPHKVRGACGEVIEIYNAQEWQSCFNYFSGFFYIQNVNALHRECNYWGLTCRMTLKDGVIKEVYSDDLGAPVINQHIIQRFRDGSCREQFRFGGKLHNLNGSAYRLYRPGKPLLEKYYIHGFQIDPRTGKPSAPRHDRGRINIAYG
jgi:hypothetical protein